MELEPEPGQRNSPKRKVPICEEGGLQQPAQQACIKAPKFQNTVRPRLVIPDTGSGLSEFIYFSLLQ